MEKKSFTYLNIFLGFQLWLWRRVWEGWGRLFWSLYKLVYRLWKTTFKLLAVFACNINYINSRLCFLHIHPNIQRKYKTEEKLDNMEYHGLEYFYWEILKKNFNFIISLSAREQSILLKWKVCYFLKCL